MFLERISLTNFRCFGPETRTINMAPGLTAFVGANGSGKTAAMGALLRLFGITSEHRRIRRQDFHVPASELTAPTERKLVLEALIAFPELDIEGDSNSTVPEFFHQMAADDSGQLKCRIRMEATWTDDGSVDGVIEQRIWAVRNLGDFDDSDCIELKAIDRSRIQVVYVPAVRDGASQVTAFLRGRLWRAITWSKNVKTAFSESGLKINNSFSSEFAVDVVTKAVEKRWREVHAGGMDATPIFRPVDLRFHEFIRRVEVVFYPDETGRERNLEDLSDGQRSLFHLAMTAATLDVENQIANGTANGGFQAGGVSLPSLTIIAVEEPENNLAPFYLSRIVRQIEDLTHGHRAQAFISSHSASILARVEPNQVRHFRIDLEKRTAHVRAIQLPVGEEEAAKFVREAVRTYPELYFARFVILGEGSSEEVVLPRLAEALDLPIDRSFVAVVPLGGRHVNHLWQLLFDLAIPHITLLDLDLGRSGGGWGRIKSACLQLLANDVAPESLFGDPVDANEIATRISNFDMLAKGNVDLGSLKEWVLWLRQFGIYFSWPLDLDFSMLRAFPGAYKTTDGEMKGPSIKGNPEKAVLGEDADSAPYSNQDEDLRWYRYLFLGRGKPSTHVRVLGRLDSDSIRNSIPEELRALLEDVANRITTSQQTEEDC
ncbi:ATP-dependent nuclease [Myxococcus virescens]|uniref:ATP-dependent nuclease n=1 Tax=Myxococcus virescens TaxID=83456 RepID=UPI003DA2B127